MGDESESVQGLNAELQALLDDLEQEAPEEQPTPTPLVPVPEPELSEPPTEPVEPENPDLPIEPSPAEIADLRETVKRFDRDYDEIQTCLKVDRSKIDGVISILLERVRNGSASEADTISLVKALSVLTDTNGHSVKLLDSRSKLLSATKSSFNAVQTNVSITGADTELQSILQQPADEDHV